MDFSLLRMSNASATACGRRSSNVWASKLASVAASSVNSCGPQLFTEEAATLASLLAQTFEERRPQAVAEALLILSNEKSIASSAEHYPSRIRDAVSAARQRLETAGIDWRAAAIEARYLSIA